MVVQGYVNVYIGVISRFPFYLDDQPASSQCSTGYIADVWITITITKVDSGRNICVSVCFFSTLTVGNC